MTLRVRSAVKNLCDSPGRERKKEIYNKWWKGKRTAAECCKHLTESNLVRIFQRRPTFSFPSRLLLLWRHDVSARDFLEISAAAAASYFASLISSLARSACRWPCNPRLIQQLNGRLWTRGKETAAGRVDFPLLQPLVFFLSVVVQTFSSFVLSRTAGKSCCTSVYLPFDLFLTHTIIRAQSMLLIPTAGVVIRIRRQQLCSIHRFSVFLSIPIRFWIDPFESKGGTFSLIRFRQL